MQLNELGEFGLIGLIGKNSLLFPPPGTRVSGTTAR